LSLCCRVTVCLTSCLPEPFPARLTRPTLKRTIGARASYRLLFAARMAALPLQVSQKSVAGSAAFQAAGVAEAPIQGYRLALPLAGRYLRMPARCRHSQGTWGEGVKRRRSVPFATPSLRERAGERGSNKNWGGVNEPLYANHSRIYHYRGRISYRCRCPPPWALPGRPWPVPGRRH